MRSRQLRFWFLPGAALGLIAAAAAAVPIPDDKPPAAPPADQAPTGLSYVPRDAGFFAHVDVAALWKGDLVKTFRDADKDLFGQLQEKVEGEFGLKIDDLNAVTLFVPQAKGNEEPKFGVALNFSKPFDKKKLAAGFVGLAPPGVKPTVVAASETLAVVLLGLDEATYGKPQPAGAEGPLADAIRAAAAGKHALVAGATLANLPEELQRDDLPGQVRALQPIFRSKSVYATVDLGKAVTLDVRVRAKREQQAVDAEKAMAAVAKMLTDELGRELPDVEERAKKDPLFKDLVTVFRAALAAAKKAEYSVDGTEARMTATLPLEGLPLAKAYLAGVQQARQAAASSQSANNLKQIGLAMHNYHDSTGSFPPAAVCDKNGKPQLSWRVLILPYIEQDALYKQFKLDEPWDSENNKKLIAKMPRVYAIPGAKAGATETHYRVFVNNGALFDWVLGTKIQQITDGTSNTFMVVTAKDPVPWTKPDELEFDPEKDMSKLIGLVVNGRAQVAMCDGSVRTLAKIPAKATLHALITKSGGEVIPADF